MSIKQLQAEGFRALLNAGEAIDHECLNRFVQCYEVLQFIIDCLIEYYQYDFIDNLSDFDAKIYENVVSFYDTVTVRYIGE